MAYDEHLAARIRAALSGEPGITEKKMFGGIAFLRNGLMFVGVSDESLMARVGAADHAESLARKGTRPMDFTGRPMTGYVFVDPAGTRNAADLRSWLDRCAAFVSTLPSKEQPRPPSPASGRRRTP